MPELVNADVLASAAMGGGGVWLAVKTELKLLWQTVRELKEEIRELRKAA